jgi:hypothetical protein
MYDEFFVVSSIIISRPPYHNTFLWILKHRRRRYPSMVPSLSVTILCQMLLISAAFVPLPRWNAGAVSSPPFSAPPFFLASQEADHNSPSQTAESEGNLEKNSAYINGLLENLTEIVDKWIMAGSPATQKRAYNVLQMIQSEAMDPELVKKSVRLMKRAGLPVAEKRAEATVDLGATDEKKRRQEAEARRAGNLHAPRRLERLWRRMRQAGRLSVVETPAMKNLTSFSGK